MEYARFIPARAGNTPLRVSSFGVGPVHPRACGEHSNHMTARSTFSGSSPRVRGTPRGQAGEPRRVRFIPARAGNTCGRVQRSIHPAVHPRACGEHSLKELRDGRDTGSSPRVRGTRTGAVCPPPPRRFIPARAGNTSSRPPCAARTAVHPRACGEHQSPGASMSTDDGSSPRVRGTPGLRAAHAAAQRFIPARAGNTVPSVPLIGQTPVHPRACGEHAMRVGKAEVLRGSSPRVRGTRVARTRGRASLRFIPARAGNTPTGCRRSRGPTVHPRACGEHPHPARRLE